MADRGDVITEVDLQTGLITIGVRPPLGLEASRVKAQISVLDYLDQAAKVILACNATTRSRLQQLGTPGGGGA